MKVMAKFSQVHNVNTIIEPSADSANITVRILLSWQSVITLGVE